MKSHEIENHLTWWCVERQPSVNNVSANNREIIITQNITALISLSILFLRKLYSKKK